MRRESHAGSRAASIRSRLLVFGLAVLVGVGGLASTVSAEGGNVRYSYEEVHVADERGYVLVPRAEGDLSGEVDEATLEQAFEELRDAKSETYGNSYADASGDDPEEATVEVHIDSNYDQYAPIIKAEAVYTFTELGVPEVEFPDYGDEPLTRADISVPAYTLTVPLWRVVPPERVSSAQILMADGDLVDVAQIERRWNEDRSGVLDDVYAFLEADEPFTVREVLRRLPDLGDLRLGDVTALLEADDSQTRRVVLNVLEGHEDAETALEAVSAALAEESDSELARKMAEFLGRSSNDEYNVEEQFYLVESGSDEEAAEAVRRLSEWGDDERAVEQLAESLRDERQKVAAGAAESLGELDEHDPRIEALEATEDVAREVRLQMAEDLADESHPERVRLEGYTHVASEREGGHAGQAIDAMAELELDEARRRVEGFLDDESRDRRRAAVQALVDRGDRQSIGTLMEVADEASNGDPMREAAYDIMVAQPLEDIMDLTRDDSMSVQEVAFRALGEKASEAGGSEYAVETIQQGVDHREPAIRAAAAESLGEIGTDDALETLGEMTDDSNAVVRRQVALALGQFDGDDYSDVLVEYLDDNDPGVIAAAIEALEQREDRRAADRIEEMIDHEAPEVRASALRAATTFLPDREEETVRRHMGTLSGAVGDDAPVVQQAALEQLGRFQNEMAVTNIATLVGTDNPDVRIAALEALAETGHEDARPLIESALGDPEPEVRREAVEALTELAGSEARPELEARMEEEDDPEVKDAIESHLQQI